jgi:hypothetical protein
MAIIEGKRIRVGFLYEEINPFSYWVGLRRAVDREGKGLVGAVDLPTRSYSY